MCYHVGISPLGGLVDSFSQLYFTINLEEIFYFNNKKSRIYAAFGVSQTPIYLIEERRELSYTYLG
jgi:hypothetical protein